MTQKVTVSMADSVFNAIEEEVKEKRNNGNPLMTRSEVVEEHLRFSIQQKKMVIQNGRLEHTDQLLV